jgi:diguanylate cyclase (GGDEF)-like protein
MLAGFSGISLFSYLRARSLMDQQITTTTLPLTSDAIISSIEHDLLQPVLASGLMANNTFLEAAVSRDEYQTKLLIEYLQSIQQKTSAVTTFLALERTGRYYHPSGILKQLSQVDPRDRWYYRFRDSGQPIEVNIDRDTADHSRITAFINVRLQDADGRFLGATGLGLDVRLLQDQFRRYQQRYGARILLVDRRGDIALGSDGSRGNLSEVNGVGPQSRSMLQRSNTNLRLQENGRALYVRATRIKEIGWTLVVIQQRTAEQSSFINLLTQNLVVALLIGVVLLVLAQLTLGRDQKRLEIIAQTDNLSGLLNRRVFEPLFQQIIASAKRKSEPVAITLMDIDHFKQVNDTHGHLVGDAVICHVSRLLKNHLRESDPLFRWGGEEFLLLLPGCNLDEARERLESIRTDLANQPIAADGAADHLTVTMSFGLTLHQPGENTTQLLHRVDQALYNAKHAGRNRICISPPADPPP